MTFTKKLLYLLALSVLLSACSKKLYVSNHTTGQVKVNAELPADSAMLRFYEPYKRSLDSQLNRVIGFSEVEMSKEQPESNLSNFFSDAIASSASAAGVQFDFAMPTTNGGIRTSLPKGAIRLSNIFELMPFENELVVLELSGDKVRELAQFIVDKGGQPVARIRIAAVDKLISSIEINGQKLDPSRTYKVLTSDYLAGGGDGISAFTEPVTKTTLSIKVRDAIITYIESETKNGRNLNPTTDGRIIIKR